MVVGIDPGTMLLIGLVGGIGAAATYAVSVSAAKAEANVTLSDLAPMSPVEGPPLPRGLAIKWPGIK